MRKIDRLLLKVQEAQRLDDMALSVAFIKAENNGKWSVIADLWDDVEYPKAKTQRLTMEYDTLEEAEQAVKDLEAVHKPTGRRAAVIPEAVVIIDDIDGGILVCD